MPRVEVRRSRAFTTYWLEGKELHAGADVLLRLRGNKGWEPVTIVGLPESLRVRTVADNGHLLVTSLPPEAELRWP